MRYISRMFTLPQMPSIKFPTIDLTNFDVTRFDLSKVDLSKFDLSKFDLSKFNLPKVDVPGVDVPKIDTAKLASVVRDAGYVAAFAISPGRIGPRTDPYALPRIALVSADVGWRLRVKVAAAGPLLLSGRWQRDRRAVL